MCFQQKNAFLPTILRISSIEWKWIAFFPFGWCVSFSASRIPFVHLISLRISKRGRNTCRI